MIQEIFLKKALMIRKNYLGIVENISNYEKMAKDLINSIENSSKELELLNGEINKGRISDMDTAKESLMKIVIGLEEEINTIDNTIGSLDLKIEDLKKEESNLHREIKQRYPELSDDEIRKEVHLYLSKNETSESQKPIL